MDQSFEKILRNFPAECDVSGTFVTKYLRISVKDHPLDPNLYGNQPKGYASLEVFLSQLEKELFSNEINEPTQSNLSAEEWKALRALAADKTVVIKAADKGSSVAVWDRSDNLQETSRQFQDKNINEDVRFSENILIDLVERSSKIFKCLCSHKLISEKT